MPKLPINCGRGRVWLAISLAVALLASAAGAQDYPARPVKVIAPFPAGGNADTLARVVGQGLSERLRQPFYIENIAGNSGGIGSIAAQRAAPDGYTLLVSGMGSHVVAPLTNPNIKYDPIADFTHVAMLGGSPLVLVINPAIGVKDLAELIAFIKRSPEPPPYSSSGAGSHSHLTAEYFQQIAGVTMRHIAYRGGSQAMNDLIADHVSIGMNSLVAAAPFIRAGTLMPIAISAAKRLDTFPDVPTFSEMGYPQLTGTTWFALSGPKGLSEPIVHKLNHEADLILARADVKGRLKEVGLITEIMDVPALNASYRDEIARWAAAARTAGLKVQ